MCTENEGLVARFESPKSASRKPHATRDTPPDILRGPMQLYSENYKQRRVKFRLREQGIYRIREYIKLFLLN
jgi:hypothetical protein